MKVDKLKKKIEEKSDKPKKDKNKNIFNLMEVIVLMIITAICSMFITIKVSYIKNSTSKKILAQADLRELTETYETLISDYYKDVDKKELINAGIRGMIDYLGDPYSTYLDEEQTEAFNEGLEGEYVGMGAEITLKDDETISISRIFDNSPAEKVKLKIGDVITKIDGTSIKGKAIDEIASLIKGKENTKVKVTILRNKKEIDFNITRQKVDIPSVSSKIIENNNKKIGVITISTFALNTYKQFSNIEKELETKGIDSLIIDLRGNSGGYLSSVKSISELFLKKGQVIYQLSVKNNVEKIIATSDGRIKLKTVVLVNGGSASASEILTASLKENLNCSIVGTKTFGKGKVQKAQILSSGAMIKYTIESWLTPNGNEIDGFGIEPTEKIEMNQSYYKNPSDNNDNQLQKALKIISN